MKQTLTKIDRWVNDLLTSIKWYNKMLIIGLAYFVGVGIRYVIIYWW